MYFCGFWLVSVKSLKSGGDDDAAELGGHVGGGRLGLGGVPGCVQAAGLGVAGWWPAVAYQQTAIAWQASMNGMVRSTARAVRLRACPVPNSCFASSIATSMDHLAAYLSITAVLSTYVDSTKCEAAAL